MRNQRLITRSFASWFWGMAQGSRRQEIEASSQIFRSTETIAAMAAFQTGTQGGSWDTELPRPRGFQAHRGLLIHRCSRVSCWILPGTMLLKAPPEHRTITLSPRLTEENMHIGRQGRECERQPKFCLPDPQVVSYVSANVMIYSADGDGGC